MLTSSSQVISYGTANTYLKIILMGDVKVGKTSLINRYIAGASGEFSPHQPPTVSYELSVQCNLSDPIAIHFVDGQEITS